MDIYLASIMAQNEFAYKTHSWILIADSESELIEFLSGELERRFPKLHGWVSQQYVFEVLDAHKISKLADNVLKSKEHL